MRYAPTVCVGGPMHGMTFHGGNYPQIDCPLPEPWRRVYSLRDDEESLKIARYLSTSYRRDELRFCCGSLELSGEAFVWSELSKNNNDANRAALALMITDGFEILSRPAASSTPNDQGY